MFDLEQRQPSSYSKMISIVFLAGLCMATSCGRTPEFSANKVFVKRLEMEVGETLPQQALQDVDHVLDLLFGTADQPTLPAGTHINAVSLEKLRRAAGRVYSDEKDVHFGLYRNNCIRCHGTSGDGRGPAARLLSPYPRDFRLGKFKFKSTAQGAKPTKIDLNRILRQGIPGTSMPSFSLLEEEDLEALTDYVIYLSVRGETERELLRQVSNLLDYDRGERLIDLKWRETDAARYQQQLDSFASIVENYYSQWETAARLEPSRPTTFPIWEAANPDQIKVDNNLRESVARGELLFRSNLTSCSKCHGEDGSGLSAPRDYDLWTKDWSLAAGIDPEDKTAIRPMLKAGAFKPVPLHPRNLRSGVFRGGEAAEDLYLRVVNGIEGTSMPAAAMRSQIAEGLTTDQVWDLVNYVLSLAELPASQMSGVSE